jgi:GNAT superfamily N-acetyltransferase
MSKALIRDATPDDAAAIGHVHVASWQAAYAGIVPQAFLDGLSEERRATFWSDALASPAPTSHTWVAVVDGSVVGFAGTVAPDPADAADVPAGAIELATIYLLPEVWGQGIGHALLTRAVAWHGALGTPDLTLWVFTANDRARSFYERNGWRLDGAARDLPTGGADLPVVRYRLDLREVST